MTIILYRGIDTSARLPSAQFARMAEPITAKPFPYRKPEAKESHTCILRTLHVYAYASALIYTKRESNISRERILRATRGVLDIISARRDRNC